MQHRLELEAELNAILRLQTTADWLVVFEKGGLPAGPILSIAEMHNDPQTVARDMVVNVDHPIAGSVETIGAPVKFSATPGGVRSAAPVMGQHTQQILEEAGYGHEEIDGLINSGATASQSR